MVDLFPLVFEGIVVVVEIFTIYLYLTGIFPRNDRSFRLSLSAYLVFGILLGTASIFYPNMILLPFITFVGVLYLAWFLYRSHVLSALFAAFLYLMLAVVMEFFVVALYSWSFSVDLESVLSYGAARYFLTMTVKLIILLLVKIISVIMEKHRDSLQQRMMQSIPLILCQLILIAVVVGRFHEIYSGYDVLTYNTIIEIAGIFFVDIIILGYFRLLVGIYELQLGKEIALMQLENQLKYYAMIKSHQDTINAIEHDMRNHIKAIEELATAGYSKEVSEYLSNYSDTINENAKLVLTPHPLVSSILSECRQRAVKADVELQLNVSISDQIEVNQIDLTVILGNTIDNAFEALVDIPTSERKINILLKQSDYYLFYEIKNSYILTVKGSRAEGKAYHGYGLNNVRACVEKYAGNFQTNVNQNEFSVTIMIPCLLADSGK